VIDGLEWVPSAEDCERAMQAWEVAEQRLRREALQRQVVGAMGDALLAGAGPAVLVSRQTGFEAGVERCIGAIEEMPELAVFHGLRTKMIETLRAVCAPSVGPP